MSSPRTANSSFLLASPSSPFTLSPSPASRATNSTVEGQSIKVPSAQKSSNKSSWTGFKKVKTVLKTSTGAFGPLRSVVDGMDELIRIFEDAAIGNGEYQNLQSELDSLLGDLSRYIDGPASRAMTSCMSNLCSEMQKEIDHARKKQQRKVTSRHFEATDDLEDILKCYRRIQMSLSRLTLNANLDMWKIANEQTTEARLNKLFPTMSAVYNSCKGEELQRGPCTQDTRLQVMTEIRAWVHNNEVEATFWLNGMAGTGKTTIAYSLCAELELLKILGANFFCSRSSPECRDANSILPSIAYQLARFSLPFRSALSTVLEEDPDVQTRSMKTQVERLLVRPLLEVKQTFPSEVVVVIDALDECENTEAAGQLLELLLRHGPQLPIKFFLSSRPESEIYGRFSNRESRGDRPQLILHELDHTSVKQDIETYLRDQLQNIKLSDSQFANLMDRSGVLFIYAATVAGYIKDGSAMMELDERLNVVLGSNSPSPISKNRHIDLLYTIILQRAFDNPRLEPRSGEQMKDVLDTVICAQEPLTIFILAGLLKLSSPDRVDALLQPFRSVLHVTKTSGLVTALHASFPEFMLDQNRSHRFHTDAALHHARLSRTCFDVIQMNISQFNICALESSYLADDEIMDLDERVTQAISPELRYACRYWAIHLERSRDFTDLVELLYDFLSVRLLLWMEVMNLQKLIHLGAGIIRRAETWSMNHRCPEELIDLAHDAWRFVSMYAGHAVSQSTPHIYVSLLPFWPKSSPVARIYMKRMRGLIKAEGSAMDRRQLALLATWPLGAVVQFTVYSPDGSRVAAATENDIHILDGSTGQKTEISLRGHTGTIHTLQFSPDSAYIVSGGSDKTVRLWDAKTGEQTFSPLQGHYESVNSVEFSHSGMYVVSGSSDKTICVWDASSGRMILGSLHGHTLAVTSARFSPDDAYIASGSGDKSIRVWSAHNGRTIHVLRGHTESVQCVAFSLDGGRIISGSSDKTIMVWDLRNETALFILQGHTDSVNSVEFSPDGKHIVSSSSDKTIRMWDGQNGYAILGLFEGHARSVESANFSPDGTRIISASWDCTVRVWDVRSRQSLLVSPDGHTNLVHSVAFSPDGTRIVSGSWDKTIRVWSANNGKMVLGPLEDHAESAEVVRFSSDGTRIVSGCVNKSMRVWDAQTGKIVFGPPKQDTEIAGSAKFSPDGAHIISKSLEMTLGVGDAKNRHVAVEGQSDFVSCVAHSPDNTYFVSGGWDKTIRLWDMRSRQMILGPLEGHTEAVYSVAISPDGKRIVSGSADKTILVWDARSGQKVLGPLKGHTASVESVGFSPDGTCIVSGSADKTIRTWDVHDGFSFVLTTFDASGAYRTTCITPADTSSWDLDESGWVLDSRSRRLIWVPPDLHAALLRPRNTLLISTHGSVKLEFDSALVGEQWTGCYKL